MNTMGGNSQKASDYVMLWNTGAAVAYLFGAIIGVVTCLEHYSGIQTVVTINSNTTFGQEFALSIIALVLSLVVCVLNIIHTRRYFRNREARSAFGLIASISFLVLVGFQLCRTVGGIATYNSADRVNNIADGVISLLNIAIWGMFAFDLINACTGTLAFWFVFRKAEEVEELIATEKEKIVVVKNTNIMADVATHAMGHPEPSKEDVEKSTGRVTPNQTMNDPLNEEVKAEEKEEEPKEEAKKVDIPEEEKTEDKLGKLDMMEEAQKKEKEEKEIKARKDLAAKEKKKLPPILSANPENEMLGKINQDGRALAIGETTFAEGGNGRGEKKLAPIAEKRDIPKSVEESMMHLDEVDIALPVDKSDDEEEPEKDELMADELPVDELPVDY